MSRTPIAVALLLLFLSTSVHAQDEDVSLGLGGAVEKQGYNGDYGEHATHSSPTHAIGNCNEAVCRLAIDHAVAGLKLL